MTLARPSGARFGHAAFTLIEMMVAVMIIAIVMGLSIPNLMSKARKDPLTQAVNDFIEACQNARELAIIRSVPMQVRISVDTQTTTLSVEPAPRRDASRFIGDGLPPGSSPPAGPDGEPVRKPPTVAPFQAHFDDSVAFSALHVNLREVVGGEDGVALRFHPNGTCDQFEGTIHHAVLGDRKVTLEVTTGWAEVKKVR